VAGREDRRRPVRRTSRSDDGQGTVELALVLPLVAVLLVAVVQVGLVVRDHVLVAHAAREAARAAVVAEAATDRFGAAERGARASGAFHPDETFVSTQLLDGGRRLRATVRHTTRTELPLIGGLVPDVPLEASATMRIEDP
jgi:Flp pilus assembly protein TadG